MLGAIIGDIVGSRFEFDNHKSKEFELFHESCFATDDSIMTLALAKAFMETENSVEPPIEMFQNNYRYLELLQKNAIKHMQRLGRKHPDCGFGGMFAKWIISDNPEPYNSYGNGAAMRVSPAGFLARTEEEAEEFSEAVTSVSHNHEEGMLGAKAVSIAIYMARHGYLKSEIREKICGMGYSLDFTIDGIRPDYIFNETCQKTVPQAIECFLESDSFEDAVRTAVSLGGDSDTLAAIAGSIAQAYYGIPEEMREKAPGYLDDELRAIYEEWEQFICEEKPRFVFLTKYIGKFTELPKYWKNVIEPEKAYYDLICEFIKEVNEFNVNNPEYGLFKYREILEKNGMDPEKADIGAVDAQGLDEGLTLALIMAAAKGEKLCEGLMLKLAGNGRLSNWLKRLKDIDMKSNERDIQEIYLELGSFGYHSIYNMVFTEGKAIRFEWDMRNTPNPLERYSIKETEKLLKDWKELHTENWLPYYPQPLYEFVTDCTSWLLLVKQRGGRGKMCGGYRTYPENWKEFAGFIGIEVEEEDDEEERFIYCSVSFSEDGATYYYRTDDRDIKEGDRVIVPVGGDNSERSGIVEKIEHFPPDEVPFPLDKTKHIIRKDDEENEKTPDDSNVLCNETNNGISAYVEAEIKEGCLHISGQDFGVPSGMMGGDGEYEYFYNFTEEETRRFSELITGQSGDLDLFLRNFVEKFKGSGWYEKFTSYCREHNLKYSAFSC